MSFRLLFCLACWALSSTVLAQDFLQRDEYVKLRDELVAEQVYDASALDAVFANVKRLDQVISLMDAPIRAPTPWHVYWPRHIGGDRPQRAIEFVNTNRGALERAQKVYGVPLEVITAIVGVETIFGRITGNTRVLDALATLAFDYPRRAEFFRSELKEFLILSKELNKSPLEARGSFAGAMGWPQFMPGSWRRWAVDFDGSGRVDLWNSREDIVGSVAAFLAGHGWQRDGVVMLPVDVPSEELQKLFNGGLTDRKPLSWWKEQGVKISRMDAGVELPPDDAVVGLISLDRADGSNEYWMAFENFYVITRYNRSRMYASSVWSLAYWLKRRPR